MRILSGRASRVAENTAEATANVLHLEISQISGRCFLALAVEFKDALHSTMLYHQRTGAHIAMGLVFPTVLDDCSPYKMVHQPFNRSYL